MKATENNNRQMMQKVFAIVNNETDEIVQFGTSAGAVKDEWDNYYVGSEDENTHRLQQTFMSQSDIKKEMAL